MSLYFDKTPIASINAAQGCYSAKEFQSPMRSTVALLSWLKHEDATVQSVFNSLGMMNFDLHLEYTVDPPKPRGVASHSDLFVKNSTDSLAVEAKWTEPRYETVGSWLTSDNRADVLSGWLGLLHQKVSSPLQPQHYSEAIYQMVHRAASACETSRNPRLAYIIFGNSSVGAATILSDLRYFKTLLGSPAGFPFYLIELPMTETPAFQAISSLKKGVPATATAVSNALFGPQRLFKFGVPKVTPI